MPAAPGPARGRRAVVPGGPSPPTGELDLQAPGLVAGRSAPGGHRGIRLGLADRGQEAGGRELLPSGGSVRRSSGRRSGADSTLHAQAGRMSGMSYQTLAYDTDGAIATITLNRPERLNTIVPPMPDEFEAAVHEATGDERVRGIVLRGAGLAFCAGYDFGGRFHHWDEMLTTDGRWDPGKDFIGAGAGGPTQKFMSIWRTPKPVIAQVHGWCVGGGSDMPLCADLVIASDDAQIGTPYSRIRGCYLSGMWLYRLGLTKAKEHALTGKPLSGREGGDGGVVHA